LIHALPDAHLRGEVKHCIDAVQRAHQSVAVPDVAHDQLHIVVEIRGPGALLVHLRHQTVERAHGVPGAQQLVSYMGSNESGAAGDENALRHDAVLSKGGSKVSRWKKNKPFACAFAAKRK